MTSHSQASPPCPLGSPPLGCGITFGCQSATAAAAIRSPLGAAAAPPWAQWKRAVAHVIGRYASGQRRDGNEPRGSRGEDTGGGEHWKKEPQGWGRRESPRPRSEPGVPLTPPQSLETDAVRPPGRGRVARAGRLSTIWTILAWDRRAWTVNLMDFDPESPHDAHARSHRHSQLRIARSPLG